MDFAFSAEEETFRREVAEFLEKEVPAGYQRKDIHLSLVDAMEQEYRENQGLPDAARHRLYKAQLAAAMELADRLPNQVADEQGKLQGGLEKLRFFRLPEESMKQLLD